MSFLFPEINRKYLIRLACVALFSFVFFGLVCRPCVIHGASMQPTYPSVGFNFCWKPAFWFRKPKRGDVVIVRYIGHRTLILKRLVAMEGDVVAFRGGVLYVNGKEFKGDWQEKGPCDWELEPRIVERGNVYVVGDNRSMSIDEHIFGQISAKRIEGAPLW